MREMKTLTLNGVTYDSFVDQTARQSAASGGNIDKAVAKYLTENPVSGGLTKTEKNLILTLFRNTAYTSGDMADSFTQLETLWGESGNVHSHSYTSSVTTAATCTTSGVRTYTCNCGHSYTESIPATGHNYVDGVCTVCGATDPTYKPDVTLTSISAIYSGGSVPVGTSVNALTGIVVTAHYSDGTSETVAGYTISGTIAEGSNSITISYGGKTTTFTVTGVEDEPDEPTVNDYILNVVNAWHHPYAKPGEKPDNARPNRAASVFYLQVGDRVNFVDSSLWNTYKYAIGLGDFGTGTSWDGGGYKTGEFTVTTTGIYTVLVARLDDANIDDAEMAFIANSFGYIRSVDDDNLQAETITHYDTIQGYPAEIVNGGFIETTNGATTIYCEVIPGDFYEVSRNSTLSTNDRFRFAFSASEPQKDVITLTYRNFDNLLKGVVQAPIGVNYLMVYVGGTSYQTIPDGFTIVRKYKS